MDRGYETWEKVNTKPRSLTQPNYPLSVCMKQSAFYAYLYSIMSQVSFLQEPLKDVLY